MSHRISPLILAGLSCFLGLSGCASTEQNARVAIGDEQLRIARPSEGLVEAQAPSVTSLDRSDWSMPTIHVPVDAIHHWPHGTSMWPAGSTTSDTVAQRNLGHAPTVDSVLQSTTQSSPGLAARDAIAGPLSVVGDAILWIPRMIDAPPGSRATSPTRSYERVAESPE